jgi:hypothetical protein
LIKIIGNKKNKGIISFDAFGEINRKLFNSEGSDIPNNGRHFLA